MLLKGKGSILTSSDQVWYAQTEQNSNRMNGSGECGTAAAEGECRNSQAKGSNRDDTL